MPNIDDARTKLNKIVGGLERRPERVYCRIGNAQGNIYVLGHADADGQELYVHLRLDDGTYYGSAYYDRSFAISYDMLVVAGYSTAQPTVFRVLEPRQAIPDDANSVAVGTIADVTGLTAVWTNDTVALSWTALPASRLFSNYLVTIDGVERHVVTNSLIYTDIMNMADHSGTFTDVLSVSVVAVDVWGLVSRTPDTLTTTWSRPRMPNLSGGTAVWSFNDCAFAWSEPVRPYTFRQYLITIGAVVYVALSPVFAYTEAMNRNDHGGVVAIELSASVVAVDRDGYTSFIPLVINTSNPIPIGDTVQDNFDAYGGEVVAQSGSAGLRWLKVIGAEATELLSYSNGAASTQYVIEGAQSAAIDSHATVFQGSVYTRDVQFNYDQEGRFTTTDYVTLVIWSSVSKTITVQFDDVDGRQINASASVVSGYNFIKLIRSDFTLASGAPPFDWSQVVTVSIISNIGSTTTVYADDLRVVKADPDNAATYNDTGKAWDFGAGTWHIYQDVPSVAYSLGQIDSNTPGTRQVARRVYPAYGAVNHFAVGVYLRAKGAVGLLALAADDNNGYEVKLNASTNTLKLLKWVGGVSTELNSMTYACDQNVPYVLGLTRDWATNNLRVFVSTDGSPIFSGSNLKMFVSDGTYLSGQVGVVSYGVNSRFFQVRAGSPEHALTSEYAFDADRLNGHRASYFATDPHDMLASHTYTGGAALDVFGLSAPNTLARLTPSSNPGATAKLLATDASGYIQLVRVGIGVTPTAAKLHISTAAGVYGETNPLVSCIYGSDASKFLNIYMDDNRNTVIQSYVASTGLGRLLLNPGTGNVGIGTTNPQAKLQVRPIANGNVWFRALSDASGTHTDITLVNDAANAYVPLSINASVLILNYDSSATTTGNVGIGTLFTEPYGVAGKLQVKGTIRSLGTDTNDTYYRALTFSPLNYRHIHVDVKANSGNSTFLKIVREINGTFNDVLTIKDSYLGLGIEPTAQLHIHSSAAQSLQDGNASIRLSYDDGGVGAAGSTGAVLTFAQRWYNGVSFARVGGIRGIKTTSQGTLGGGIQLLYAPTTNTDMLPGVALIENGNVGINTTAPAYKLDVIGSARFGDATNYALFSDTGTLTLAGSATVFDDEKGNLSVAKLVSLAGRIVQDDAESAYYFKDTTTTADYLWLLVQFGHNRKLTSLTSPHLHWWQTSASIPNWVIQYRWQKQGAAKTTAWTSIKWTSHAFTYVSGTLCQITDFSDITPPSGDGISDQLQIRLIRDTGNATGLFTGADPLTGNVYVTDFDVHKEIDSLGSNSEYVKA